jgi:uncharacterized protein (TIGR03083 family)
MTSQQTWTRAPGPAAYRAVRTSMTELLADRLDSAGLPVPACPKWTVRDAVAHLVSICHSVNNQVSRDDAVVATDRLDLAALLDEWTKIGEQVEDQGTPGAIMVMDAFTHELDVRAAIGVPAPADHPAYAGAFDVVAGGFSHSVFMRKLPAIRIETHGEQWTAGDGLPVVVLRGSAYDLFRSLGGRRTHEQIAALSWSARPDTWLPAFEWGPFRPPLVATEAAAGD